MIRIIPIKDLALFILGLAMLAAIAVFYEGVPQNEILPSLRRWYQYSSMIIGATFLILNIQFVWDFLWKYILAPAGYFPYINGKYSVEISHNWPIISETVEYANREEKIPDQPIGLGKTILEAEIKIGFIRTKLEIKPVVADSGVIKKSRAISLQLLAPCDELPHRLMYIYKQDNKGDRVTKTDTNNFYGAAVLEIEDSDRFDGDYWSNRSWQRGLNTAGTIAYRRQ